MDFEKVQEALSQQIKKYSNLQVVNEDNIMKQPDAPYIAISQYGPVQTYTGAAMSEWVRVHFQIKVITEGGSSDMNPEAKPQCEKIADWLRKLWFFEEPKYELLNQGIEPVQPCGTLGTTALYLVNFNQYTDGADLTVVVNDRFDDNTRPGRIDVVKTNYTKKPIRKND